MAKTTAALERLARVEMPLSRCSLIPQSARTGKHAMLGDVLIAEPARI